MRVAGHPPQSGTVSSRSFSRSARARDTKTLMAQELDWCGQPIPPGGCYGGKPEHISKPCAGRNPEVTDKSTCQWKAAKPGPAAKQHQHFAVITESHLAEIFGNGAYTLTRAEAAKLLKELTGTHRTTAYRALKLDGRFGPHLHTDGTTLSWRTALTL